MASVSYSDGRATVQFIDVDSKRKSIRLGAVPKRTAEAIKLRVEALLNAKITNTPVDRDTATWLTGIGTVTSRAYMRGTRRCTTTHIARLSPARSRTFAGARFQATRCYGKHHDPQNQARGILMNCCLISASGSAGRRG